MQDNLNIKPLIDDLKKNVLGNQHNDFADAVNIFVSKNDWFEVDEIKKFIEEHGDTFSNDKDGKVLFGVLKFFLDTAVIQNHDINIDNVYNLLDKFQDKLSWEQSCDLLMDFLDKDWNKDPNNKDFDNAKKTVENSLSYLSKLESKKAYTSEFSCTQKYFKKIMTDVPEIKTPEYLSYISKKLSETDFPPQFCFEFVWLFGDELLKTDIKNLGWYAQFARFRLEIAKMVEQRYPRQQCPQIYQTASGSEMNFTACITNCFNYMDCLFRCSDFDIKPKMSNIMLEYLNNEDVSWKTKFSVINYIPFDDYYEFILKKKKWEDGTPYNNLLKWKSALRKKFSSPNDLLNNYAETFPQVKDDYEFDRQNAYERRKNGCYVLCFVYSKKEIYECIKNFANENDDAWKSMFLWKATTYYKKNLPESQVNITDFFKTPEEFLDNFLKSHGIIDEFNAKQIKKASWNINIRDLFSYSIDEIKNFIENTNDPNKLALLFYTTFDKNDILGEIFKSPLDILDIHIKLYPKLRGYVTERGGLHLVCKQLLLQGFKTEQLAAALKETDDPKKMILLLNTLNLDYCRIEDIKEMFNNPKDLFDACIKTYKSKNNIEINEENCKCPQPLLNILKKYDKQELDRFTQYFKEENDPLTKSWLSDLVDVKQNFFETYRNVSDFLDKNKDCPKCVKNSLNGIISKKCNSGFDQNDYLWLLGLGSDYSADTKDRDAFIYSEDIEERCKLISNLFSNSDQHGRTVISKWFIELALKYHENIWKAVLGLIIYCDEESKDIKSISLCSNLEILCNRSGDYNLRRSRYNEVVLQIQNLTLQIDQILTLNWKWFTIVGTLVYLWQLYSLKKRRSHLTAEKNRLQPFVDRLDRAKRKIKLFGLQTNDRDLNKPTPFQCYEKYQARVEELLTDMQEAINHQEKEKMLNENKQNEQINNNPSVISTKSNEEHAN